MALISDLQREKSEHFVADYYTRKIFNNNAVWYNIKKSYGSREEGGNPPVVLYITATGSYT